MRAPLSCLSVRMMWWLLGLPEQVIQGRVRQTPKTFQNPKGHTIAADNLLVTRANSDTTRGRLRHPLWFSG